MALLNPLKKGIILYGDASHDPANESDLIEHGRAYEEQGRLSDALDFYGQAGFHEGIEEISRRALVDGDFFLFHRASVLIGRDPDVRELADLAENALKAGRLTFARQAFEAAGDKKGIKRAEEELKKGGFIPTES
ncbi:MAG: hypothetical protein JW885_16995 [Deltaproteobacteria bacterium]|nr:hypothetical protein [Candidatus Zymogenaceae bacterium]